MHKNYIYFFTHIFYLFFNILHTYNFLHFYFILLFYILQYSFLFLKNLQQLRKATQVSAWVARSLLLALMDNNCGNCVLENNVFYPIRVDYTNSIIVFPSNLDIRHPETVHQKYSYSPRNFSDNSSHFFVHSFLFFVFLRSTYLL